MSITKKEYWVCEYCGLELSFEEVCKSEGHDCKARGNEKERAGE